MRRPVKETQCAVIRSHGGSFFERSRQKLIERQSLHHCRIDLPRADTERVFSRAEPIQQLLVGAHDGHIRIGVEPSEKFRPQIGVLVEKDLRRADRA